MVRLRQLPVMIAIGVVALCSVSIGSARGDEPPGRPIKIVNHGASGGGFGNTVQLEDGALVSVYSYRGTDNHTHLETVPWRVPKRSSKGP